MLCDNKECPIRDKCARANKKPAPGQEIRTFNFNIEIHPFTKKEITQCSYQKPN